MARLPISNALSEAISDSISELFNRDPETLTEADLDRIIGEMRANRQRYELAEATGAKPPRTTTSRAKPILHPATPGTFKTMATKI